LDIFIKFYQIQACGTTSAWEKKPCIKANVFLTTSEFVNTSDRLNDLLKVDNIEMYH